MNDRVMVFKLNVGMYEKLEELAKIQERTKAFIIRKSIEKYIEENKQNATS